MYVLTPAYAHLEFDSKLKSAGAMTWLGSTSLAQIAAAESGGDSAIQALPEFLNSLCVSGVPSEIVQAWLKQVDFASENNFGENFRKFQAEAL